MFFSLYLQQNVFVLQKATGCAQRAAFLQVADGHARILLLTTGNKVGKLVGRVKANDENFGQMLQLKNFQCLAKNFKLAIWSIFLNESLTKSDVWDGEKWRDIKDKKKCEKNVIFVMNRKAKKMVVKM